MPIPNLRNIVGAEDFIVQPLKQHMK